MGVLNRVNRQIQCQNLELHLKVGVTELSDKPVMLHSGNWLNKCSACNISVLELLVFPIQIWIQLLRLSLYVSHTIYTAYTILFAQLCS